MPNRQDEEVYKKNPTRNQEGITTIQNSFSNCRNSYLRDTLTRSPSKEDVSKAYPLPKHPHLSNQKKNKNKWYMSSFSCTL